MSISKTCVDIAWFMQPMRSMAKEVRIAIFAFNVRGARVNALTMPAAAGPRGPLWNEISGEDDQDIPF